MKPGDIIEWRGVNRIHRGTIVKSSSENEVLLCQLDNGKSFLLDDISHSRSVKITEI